MKPNPSARFITYSFLIAIISASLSLSACTVTIGKADSPTMTPTASPEPALTLTAQPTGAPTLTATPASPTARPTTPPRTATPLPPGKVVNIAGVVQNIHITNNTTIITVNNINYQVPPTVLVIITKYLKSGVPIVFTGRAEANGLIIIVSVVKINNITIVINEPKKHKDKGDDDDDDQD